MADSIIAGATVSKKYHNSKKKSKKNDLLDSDKAVTELHHDSDDACGNCMLLVPPKERLHFSAVRAEKCGLSEEELIRMTTRDL